MQSRWESYLTTAEEVAPKVKAHVQNAPSVKEQAANAKDKAQASFADAGRSERSTPTTTGYDQRGTGSADSTQ